MYAGDPRERQCLLSAKTSRHHFRAPEFGRYEKASSARPLALQASSLLLEKFKDFFLSARSLTSCSFIMQVHRLRTALHDFENSRWRWVASRVGHGLSPAACRDKAAELEEEPIISRPEEPAEDEDEEENDTDEDESADHESAKP